MRLCPCQETQWSRCLTVVTKALSVPEPGKTSGPIALPLQKLGQPVASTVPGPCQSRRTPKGAASPQHEAFSPLPLCAAICRGNSIPSIPCHAPPQKTPVALKSIIYPQKNSIPRCSAGKATGLHPWELCSAASCPKTRAAAPKTRAWGGILGCCATSFPCMNSSGWDKAVPSGWGTLEGFGDPSKGLGDPRGATRYRPPKCGTPPSKINRHPKTPSTTRRCRSCRLKGEK